jgi:branched-chain amino acid aminotransferase
VIGLSIEKSDYIWLNGMFVPWDEAKTHVLDHGLHYGTGIFEGIRAYETQDGNSAVFRLDEHIERLFKSARILRMVIPYDQKKIKNVIVETVRKNKLKECYIRPLVWYGYRELGLRARELPVNAMVAVWGWSKYLEKEGVNTKISTWMRNHPNSFPSEAKIVGGYINSVLATEEARIAGYDEAILLDNRGFISEGPGENIFIVENEKILTPPPNASILRGITRHTVIVIARELRYTVNEVDINRSRLYNADEAFFTGTAAEITPIYDVDGRKIGSGKTGPITKKIQEKYYAIVRGKNQQYKRWLTYLYD